MENNDLQTTKRPKADSKSVRIADVGASTTLKPISTSPVDPQTPGAGSTASPTLTSNSRVTRTNSQKMQPRKRRSTKVGKGEDLSKQRRIIIWEDASSAPGGGMFFSHPKFFKETSSDNNGGSTMMMMSTSNANLNRSANSSFSSASGIGIPFVSHVAIVSPFGAPVGEEVVPLTGADVSLSLQKETSRFENKSMKVELARMEKFDFSLTTMAPADRIAAPVALAEKLFPEIASRIPFCSGAARDAYMHCTVYTDVGMREGHLNSDGLAKAGFFGLAEIDLEALGSAIRSNDGKRVAEATTMRLAIIDCAIRQLVRRRKMKWKQKVLERAQQQAADSLEIIGSEAIDGENGSPLIPTTKEMPSKKATIYLDDETEEEALDREPLTPEEIIGEVIRVSLIQALVAFQPEQLSKVGKEVMKLVYKSMTENKAKAAAQKREALNSYKFPFEDKNDSQPTQPSFLPTVTGNASPLLNASLGLNGFASSAMSMSQYGALTFEVPSSDTIIALPIAKLIDSTLQDLYNIYQRLPKLYEAELVFKKDLRTRLLLYAAMKPAITQIYTASKIDTLLQKYQGNENALEREIYSKYGPPIHPVDLFADWYDQLKSEMLAKERPSVSKKPAGSSISHVYSSAGSFSPFNKTPKGRFQVHDGSLDFGKRSKNEDDIEGANAVESESDDDPSSQGVEDVSIKDSPDKIKQRESFNLSRRIANRVTPLQLRMHNIANVCLSTVDSLRHKEELAKAEEERKRRQAEETNLKTLFDDLEEQYSQEEYAKLFKSLGIDRHALHPKEEIPDDILIVPQTVDSFSAFTASVHLL